MTIVKQILYVTFARLIDVDRLKAELLHILVVYVHCH